MSKIIYQEDFHDEEFGQDIDRIHEKIYEEWVDVGEEDDQGFLKGCIRITVEYLSEED